MLDHEYHERIDTHGVVLHRRFEIQQHYTVIHTMKKLAFTCLPMPADARCE